MSKSKIKLIGIIVAVVIVIVSIGIAAFMAKPDKKTEEPPLNERLKEKLVAYETDLRDSLGSLDSNEKVAQYLTNWAKNKEIPATVDQYGNVIFTIKSTASGQDASPAAVLCSYDANNMDSYIEDIAVAMCIAKNAQDHGKLSVIFLAETDGDKAGVIGLDAGHFTDETEIFYLGNAAASKVSTITGGYRHLEITHKLKYEKTSYDTAYKISIRNCPSQILNADIDAFPNPIKTLGDVLANFKSTSLLFELSSFYGGTSEDLTADKASMTVVISSSDAEKFEAKMNQFIEKFNDKYLEDYPEITYTYEEVDLPSKVFTGDDTNTLVSLMYTAFDGVYYRDDDGNVIALTNIGKISSKNKKLKIDIAAMSSDEIIMNELSEVYETICGLSDLQYQCVEEYPIFFGAETSANFVEKFKEAFTQFTGDIDMQIENSVEFTPCTILQQKNDKLPILYCAITEKTKHKFSGAIITYLNSSGDEEEK